MTSNAERPHQTTTTVTGWVGYGWNEATPYSYGDSVYYQDDSVYQGDQVVASAEEYTQQAEENTAPALVHFDDGQTQQWLMVRLEDPEAGK